MLFNTKKVAAISLQVAVVSLLQLNVSTNAYAAGEYEPMDAYELKTRMLQQKRQAELNRAPSKPLKVSPTSNDLSVSSGEYYDEYVITVTNQEGFKKQVTNRHGGVSLNELDLPYDGQYSYEVLAIKHTDEMITDVLNNGRGQDDMRNMTVSKKSRGHFSVVDGAITVPQKVAEPKNNDFPSKTEQPQKTVKRSFFGMEK